MLSIDSAARSLVSLRDLHLSFGSNRVLKGIDLDVERGQAVSIIGPSGSGKSTILRCITGLLQAQGGSIRVGQTQVDELTREAERIELRKRVGFVFQQYNLFPHLSVLENLVIAPRKVLGIERGEAEKQARALLAKVRMEHKADAYPGQLSGGQQQRVAIARALTMRPELILFDEVTSALDPETVGEVLTVIRELTEEGMTCLLVTHEMRFAEEISDRVYFTENGRIVEHGSAEQIFQRPTSERTAEFLRHALGESGRRQAPVGDPFLLSNISRYSLSV
ncbi:MULTISPECIES: amino acid ABC transporter ATP-binding protein [Pseudomonas syringae group genomosp. 2]|uniref:Phosphate ABC transporter ATP-binding protein n=2 Tax=Pseudomonas amygdali pv. mori TaxID=34065 RepID=A0A3M4V4I5_PSEA0|nr:MULTISPECIES: amino acid ABC transporter ATP-binding protein [Pseudomonas syringae group genomosp. 2]EGH23769.1 phosphate ABC transporter ATP-binding protein [Pseudomonas amygdali pv. mori str. 301020]KPX41663.1 Phosphate ABC transporter ATP-binding protein [Pseudomonas ficuserectae]RMQ33908.1 Phosphate ABC transporter ATP-binding protein [Pseudomonas amygdali pv. mori]RMR46513.1 Phosphate ABC transporter ATP-binding protein [Pseudomonas amygdali pv. mori]RMS34712.1 Phosphate ABC transporte